MKREYHPDHSKISVAPTHPGVLFAEDVLPSLGRHTLSEIAAMLGVSRTTLHRLLKGEIAMSPEMALRIGKLVGNGPRIWMALQAAYDAWHTRKRIARELEKIPTLQAV